MMTSIRSPTTTIPVSGEGTYDKPQAVREHEQLTALQRAQQQSQEHGLEYDDYYQRHARPMTGVSFAGLSPTRPTTGISWAPSSPNRPRTGLSQKSIESHHSNTTRTQSEGGRRLLADEHADCLRIFARGGTPASPDLRGWTPPAAPRELEAEGGL